MRAVIYARYSSTNQTEMSIDAQVRACREYANKKNLNIINIYKDEAMTGTNADRFGYQNMLSDAFNGEFDIILIHKYDRIARSLSEQVSLDDRLKKLGIRLIAVAQDYGVGKDADLTKGIQWVLGGYYSANLSEEVKKGHKEIALKGLHNGGVAPFGYDIIDQKYVINEVEAAFVRRMFQATLNGEGLKNIIYDLEAAGIKGKRGKKIAYSQIYEMLNNEKYTGTYLYCPDEETTRSLRRNKPNAIRIENAIPQIVSKEDFFKVREILLSRKQSGKQVHRCSGLVYCGRCGSKMHINRSTRKGHLYENFTCSNKCGIGVVRVSFIDDAVDAYLKEFFSDQNIILLEKEINRIKSESTLRTKSFEKEKQILISRKEREINELLNALASGAFANNYEVCNALITQKKSELENIKRMKVDNSQDKKIRGWIKGIVDSNKAPKAFIEKIIATKDRVEIITNFNSVVSINGCGDTSPIKNTTKPDDSVAENTGCGGSLPRILTTFVHLNGI